MAKSLFGTDGIRGRANVYPMTSEVALQVGKAIAYVVKQRCNKGDERHKIVIGKDTRLSGYMLETALTSGIVAMGVDVLLVGPLPTPAVAHLTKSMNADAGIMLTASHNPYHDNGLKIFDQDGYKISDEIEKQIEQIVTSQSILTNHIPSEGIGKAHRVDDAKGRYIEFAKSSIKSMPLNGTKIILDCANGSAYHIAPDIFKELGAEVVVTNNEPDGHNINRNCGATHPELITSLVKEKGADIGIAFDGDADRVIVSDENGEIVDGDKIIAMCALSLKERGKLKEASVVTTVMANQGFEIAMKNNGIEVIRTKVGDRYVIEAMREKNISIGGEQSGHVIFLNYATTGDGIITALQLLRIMKNTKKKVSVLATCMESLPQVLVNVKVSSKPDISTLKANSTIKEVEAELGSQGRVLIRYSGTEPLLRVMLEGTNKDQIQALAEKIANAVKDEIGA